ncbi:hypothetical protein Bca52824_032236 [Brassica carinata]|uniref:Uncharacterized protein n=1 Tax=Brassica carinata TaxID=52824 RepID=A0A8X7V4Y4_BRACI|nr:hypothetical protein Bca52824_032236 [Brassica carinata]
MVNCDGIDYEEDEVESWLGSSLAAEDKNTTRKTETSQRSTEVVLSWRRAGTDLSTKTEFVVVHGSSWLRDK